MHDEIEFLIEETLARKEEAGVGPSLRGPNCPDEILLMAVALDQAPVDQQREVEDHAAHCGECRWRLEDYRKYNRGEKAPEPPVKGSLLKTAADRRPFAPKPAPAPQPSVAPGKTPIPDIEMLAGVPELVKGLWRADQDQTGAALQDPVQFRLARDWLMCILLETPALLGHIHLLESLYGEPFSFPSRTRGPRPEPISLPSSAGAQLREWWQSTPPGGQSSPRPSTTTFSPRQPPSPELAAKVVREGPEQLLSGELAALLLSPVVLCDIAERISLSLPEYWLPHMERLGRELIRRHGLENG